MVGRFTGVWWSLSPMPAPYIMIELSSRLLSPSRRVLHLLEQIPEERHVIGVDLRRLGDLLRIELVVRHRVVAVGHADPRIGASAQLARDLERDHPRDVGLERQQVQVEHQAWRARRTPSGMPTGCSTAGSAEFWVCRSGALNPLFDVAHCGQVLVDHRCDRPRRDAAGGAPCPRPRDRGCCGPAASG